jgi:hypothetical protein
MHACCIIKKFKFAYYTYDYLTLFHESICLFHFLFIRFYLVTFLSPPHIKISTNFAICTSLSPNFVWLHHLHIIKKCYSLLNISPTPTKLPFLFRKIKASNKSSFILVLFVDIINPASLKTLSLAPDVA